MDQYWDGNHWEGGKDSLLPKISGSNLDVKTLSNKGKPKKEIDVLCKQKKKQKILDSWVRVIKINFKSVRKFYGQKVFNRLHASVLDIEQYIGQNYGLWRKLCF